MLARMLNVAKAALNPAKRSVIFKKAVKRVTDRPDAHADTENRAWIAAHVRDFADDAMASDPELWKEAVSAGEALKNRAAETLAAAGVKMGGGGFYPMLYFLARKYRPAVVVETGVAAGYSSQMLLQALDLNGEGLLLSSDFPYFRLDSPEKFIGILVEERLKPRWRVYIDGDEANLPLIVEQVDHIDLFHYDSDKSRSGRAFAVNLVLPKMAKGSRFVMDDIQDDSFFRDLVTQRNIESFSVFEFGGKNIGMFEVGS